MQNKPNNTTHKQKMLKYTIFTLKKKPTLFTSIEKSEEETYHKPFQ